MSWLGAGKMAFDGAKYKYSVSQRVVTTAEAKVPGLKVERCLLVGGSSKMPMFETALQDQLGWTRSWRTSTWQPPKRAADGATCSTEVASQVIDLIVKSTFGRRATNEFRCCEI